MENNASHPFLSSISCQRASFLFLVRLVEEKKKEKSENETKRKGKRKVEPEINEITPFFKCQFVGSFDSPTHFFLSLFALLGLTV